MNTPYIPVDPTDAAGNPLRYGERVNLRGRINDFLGDGRLRVLLEPYNAEIFVRTTEVVKEDSEVIV